MAKYKTEDVLSHYTSGKHAADQYGADIIAHAPFADNPDTLISTGTDRLQRFFLENLMARPSALLSSSLTQAEEFSGIEAAQFAKKILVSSEGISDWHKNAIIRITEPYAKMFLAWKLNAYFDVDPEYLSKRLQSIVARQGQDYRTLLELARGSVSLSVPRQMIRVA